MRGISVMAFLLPDAQCLCDIPKNLKCRFFDLIGSKYAKLAGTEAKCIRGNQKRLKKMLFEKRPPFFAESLKNSISETLWHWKWCSNMEVKYEYCIHIYAQMQMKRWHRWTVASAHTSYCFVCLFMWEKDNCSASNAPYIYCTNFTYILLFERYTTIAMSMATTDKDCEYMKAFATLPTFRFAHFHLLFRFSSIFFLFAVDFIVQIRSLVRWFQNG